MCCGKIYGFDVIDDPVARAKAIAEVGEANIDVDDDTNAHIRWHGTGFAVYTLELAKVNADILAGLGKDVHTWHNGDMVYHSYADGRKGEGWPK